MTKDPDAYRTISEVAEALAIPPHVLRFWETKFPQIKPLKRGGGRRFYHRADVDLLRAIRGLLYEDAYTIRGVQRLLKSKGSAGVSAMEPGSAPPDADRDGAAEDREGVRPFSSRDLIRQIAAEIAACRSILSDAMPEAARPPDEATRPPPAAADPADPASAAPPP